MEYNEYLDIEIERLEWMLKGCVNVLEASENLRGAEVQSVEKKDGSTLYYVKMPGQSDFKPVGGLESPIINWIMISQNWLDIFLKTEQDLRRAKMLRNTNEGSSFGGGRIPEKDYEPLEFDRPGAAGCHVWTGDEPPVPLKEETDRRLYRGLDFESRSGTAVRSPAEAQLADELEAWGIPYFYEFAHYIGENMFIPEFTIYSTKHNREIVWLHCDDVTDEKSRIEVSRRQLFYAMNGFTPSWDMMVSYGDRKGNLKLEPARIQLGFWFDRPSVDRDIS
jgi:hypothetical protein